MQFDKNLFLSSPKVWYYGLDMSLQVLCATVEDEPQFRDLIGQWIVGGVQYPSFQHLWVRVRRRGRVGTRYQEEAKEAEEALREMGADSSECGRENRGRDVD